MADKKQDGDVVVNTKIGKEGDAHRKFWANPSRCEQKSTMVSDNKKKVHEIKEYPDGSVKRSLKGIIKDGRTVLDFGIKPAVYFKQKKHPLV